VTRSNALILAHLRRAMVSSLPGHGEQLARCRGMSITRLVTGGTMSRYTHSLLPGAGLATVLAACHPSTPTTSVSTLSYQVQSSGQRTTAAGDPARAPQPAARDAAPAQTDPNDPMRLFDMP
jgi:hypothetical protein